MNSRLFRVEKRPVCLGTGDPPIEWSTVVRAHSSSAVYAVLKRLGKETGVVVTELKSHNTVEFDYFLRHGHHYDPDKRWWD